jgi:hypothetical protein
LGYARNGPALPLREPRFLARIREKWSKAMAVTETDHDPAEDEHDIWVHMTPEMRHALKAEDSVAWQQVVGVLLFIISVGLVLAVFTASLSWRW